ncbi:hypothetical protein [Streptomyces sp. NPDC002054]|uniref:hypothetical protein n=1 Tax=Streptomyces sp. NPDC002054 TaxID=3154663 RepID=UPI00332035BA
MVIRPAEKPYAGDTGEDAEGNEDPGPWPGATGTVARNCIVSSRPPAARRSPPRGRLRNRRIGREPPPAAARRSSR